MGSSHHITSVWWTPRLLSDRTVAHENCRAAFDVSADLCVVAKPRFCQRLPESPFVLTASASILLDHRVTCPDWQSQFTSSSRIGNDGRNVKCNRQLCVDTKVHVYRALLQSVLLYGSETWTLLASDIKKLEAFHLRCQRQLLCVRWRDHIANEAICKQTKLTSLTELISRRRKSLFGRIVRLDAAVPAHQALWLQTNISAWRNPGTSWKRLPCRPRKTWTFQIPDDPGMSSRAYWDASTRRGHGRGTLRSLKTTRWWVNFAGVCVRHLTICCPQSQSILSTAVDDPTTTERQILTTTAAVTAGTRLADRTIRTYEVNLISNICYRSRVVRVRQPVHHVGASNFPRTRFPLQLPPRSNKLVCFSQK